MRAKFTVIALSAAMLAAMAIVPRANADNNGSFAQGQRAGAAAGSAAAQQDFNNTNGTANQQQSGGCCGGGSGGG